jgi:hypothetical protein
MDLTLRFYCKNKHLLRKHVNAKLAQTTTRRVRADNPTITRAHAEWKREFSKTIIGELSFDVSIGSYFIEKKRIWVFLTTTGKVYFPRRIQYNDGEVIEIVQDWAYDCYREFNGQSKMKRFWEKAKEELVAAAWHPDRVAKWLEAGISVEDM